MREIVIPVNLFKKMASHLLQDESLEQVAFAFVGSSRYQEVLRLLVREVWLVEPVHNDLQTGVELEVGEDFMRQVLGKVRDSAMGLLEIHSHPSCDYGVSFSPTDIATEIKTFPYVARKISRVPHAAMVMGRQSVDAHMWDRVLKEIVPIHAVRIVGYPPGYLYTTSSNSPKVENPQIFQDVFKLSSHTSNERKRMGLDVNWQDSRSLEAIKVAVVGDPELVPVLARELSRRGVKHILALAVNSERDVYALTDTIKHVDLLTSVTNDEPVLGQLNVLAIRHYLPYVALLGSIDGRGPARPRARGGVFVVLPDTACLCCQGIVSRGRQGQKKRSSEVSISRIVERGVEELLHLAQSSQLPQSWLLPFDSMEFESLAVPKQINCPCCGHDFEAGLGDLFEMTNQS
jgi:hypothetical protein